MVWREQQGGLLGVAGENDRRGSQGGSQEPDHTESHRSL